MLCKALERRVLDVRGAKVTPQNAKFILLRPCVPLSRDGTEVSGENRSIVTDYQYETNTYSDSQFLKDSLGRMGKQEEQVTVVTDGAYAGQRITELSEEKNVCLVHTNLTGREAEDILADFEFNEEGNKVLKCPGGFEPKSCSYNQSTGQCVVSFHRKQCEQCPHKKQCHPKMLKRVSRKTVSVNAKHWVEQQRYRNTEEFRKLSRFRNGVETIPSTLHRKYQVDKIQGAYRKKASYVLPFCRSNHYIVIFGSDNSCFSDITMS